MAYPTLDSAYGFKPINLTGGTSFAGSTRRIPIDGSYATKMYNGDLVTIAANGTATKITGETGVKIAGVFMGCEYTNANDQLEFDQMYPGTSVSNAFAVVMDNPSVLCKVALVDTAGAVDDDVALRTVVGSNAKIEQALTADSSQDTTKNSKIGLDIANTNTTNTFPLRIIDLVEDTKTSDGYYVEAIVKFNTHQYNDTTGV